jgi:hypothetical protein
MQPHGERSFVDGDGRRLRRDAVIDVARLAWRATSAKTQ